MKVFGYIRTSGESQLDGGGPARQLEAITAFCEENELELVNVFTEAISGTIENEERPVFTQLLDCLAGSGVGAIVIERMDRLARKIVVSERIYTACNKHGVAMYSADQGLRNVACNAEPTLVLMRQVFGAFYEYERATIVQKMEAGAVVAKREHGIAKGTKPYGSTPEEQLIIARIRQLRAQDPPMSFGKIAAELAIVGFRNRKGNAWTPQQIHNMLKNADSRVV